MAGYNPASNSTSNLPQSRLIYYDKRFVENLKSQTPFLRCAERRELPLNSGNQLELFMYKLYKLMDYILHCSYLKIVHVKPCYIGGTL